MNDNSENLEATEAWLRQNKPQIKQDLRQPEWSAFWMEVGRRRQRAEQAETSTASRSLLRQPLVTHGLTAGFSAGAVLMFALLLRSSTALPTDPGAIATQQQDRSTLIADIPATEGNREQEGSTEDRDFEGRLAVDPSVASTRDPLDELIDQRIRNRRVVPSEPTHRRRSGSVELVPSRSSLWELQKSLFGDDSKGANQ